MKENKNLGMREALWVQQHYFCRWNSEAQKKSRAHRVPHKDQIMGDLVLYAHRVPPPLIIGLSASVQWFLLPHLTLVCVSSEQSWVISKDADGNISRLWVLKQGECFLLSQSGETNRSSSESRLNYVGQPLLKLCSDRFNHQRWGCLEAKRKEREGEKQERKEGVKSWNMKEKTQGRKERGKAVLKKKQD